MAREAICGKTVARYTLLYVTKAMSGKAFLLGKKKIQPMFWHSYLNDDFVNKTPYVKLQKKANIPITQSPHLVSWFHRKIRLEVGSFIYDLVKFFLCGR